jgi:dihydroorotate dehydrogenase electron transfer subunit
VVANAREAGDTWRLALRLAGWSAAAPGQFVMLSPGALAAVRRTDPLLPRPMAVYRERGPETFEVLYKLTGRGTRLLAEARTGERVAVVGPLGRGFADPPPGSRAILVGGGTGIASLYGLAARLAASRVPVAVRIGAARDRDLMGIDDFAALEVDLGCATEDGSRGLRGLVTQLLERDLAGPAGAQVYACGPTAMMRRAAELAAAHGSACCVSLENHMACGFGVCLGCAAPRRAGGFALVCRDGPVFDAAEIAWQGLP